MKTFLDWPNLIAGAVLGSILIPTVSSIYKKVGNWWHESRPPQKLLQGMARQDEPCKIFVRDFFVRPEAQLFSIDPRAGLGLVRNVQELWPDVEGRAATSIFSILGRVGKTQNVEIVRMSQDQGEWNCHVVVLGAQAQKPYDFYQQMQNVAYRMDDKNIYDCASNNPVHQEDGFRYGLILKAHNPFKTEGTPGVAFLIGGFGTMGTAAAAYYFREHYRELGKDFGTDCFGVVVRASVTAGEQAVERIGSLDRRFSN
jgi:hypothetical protein